MHGHEHFDELTDLLTSPGTDEAGRRLTGGGTVSRQLLGEVLSRVAVNTPPVTTRVDIANGVMLRLPLPLSESSVSKASTALLRHGLLEHGLPNEDDRQRERRGRPGVPLRLCRTGWFSIGLHLDQDWGVPARVTAVAANLEGQVLASVQRKITADRAGGWPIHQVVDTIVTAVENLIDNDVVQARKQEDWLPLLGMGVETGRHVHQGKVIDRSPDGHWHEYDLGDALTEKLGVPVVVENDANALAVRETYGNQVSHQDFALVLVTDEGVGSAITVGGRVYRGSHGIAGEIGHITVKQPNVATRTGEPAGYGFDDPCWCGQPDHVDVFATPLRVRHELGVEDLGKIGEFDAEQRQRAPEVFAAAGRALGQGITALINIVNPAEVLLILPPAFSPEEEGHPGAKYLKEVKAEIDSTFSTGGTDAKLTIRTWGSEQLTEEGARAAAIRVLIEFIDHLTGIDGCPPSDGATPSGPGRGTTALVGALGGHLGAAVGAVVGGAIGGPLLGAAAFTALRARRRSSREPAPTTRPRVGEMARIDLARRSLTLEEPTSKR